LVEDDEIRQRWASRYEYLMVDECQDNNFVQCQLASLLARDHNNIMGVGDLAQSIYKFRGARPELFADFAKDWPSCKVVKMNRNYRSGPEVIEAGNAVARHMQEGMWMGVDMKAERQAPAVIERKVCTDLDAEGLEIVQRIVEAHEDGMPWKSAAVLYRTNAQSRGIEEACLSRRIPYVVIGGVNFYERKEVRDLLAYLRVADGRGTFKDIQRCINSPFRYLGKAFVDRIEGARRNGQKWTDVVRSVASTGKGIQNRQRTSVEQWAGLIDSCSRSIEIRKGMSGAVMPGAGEILTSPTDDPRPHMPAALLEMIVSETDFLRWLTRDEGAETVENNRVSNVRELVRAAERFTSVEEFLDYIDETVEAARRAKGDKNADRVTLCSLHRSKGLEWSFVAVAGCNEKIIPHARASDIEEERRLFYVGVTRAMDVLHVSSVKQATCGDVVRTLSPSRFIGEAFGDVAQQEEVA
jgi:DNA helicase-2/ATP-dependent DNA helicase PcrA